VNALSSGGSHLVDEKRLNDLLDSLEEGKITGLGETLLRTIVSKLRLNNARLSLERGDDPAVVIETLETVLSQPLIPYPIVDGVRELMYEFDLGIRGIGSMVSTKPSTINMGTSCSSNTRSIKRE
jgi:hypothetical protein